MMRSSPWTICCRRSSVFDGRAIHGSINRLGDQLISSWVRGVNPDSGVQPGVLDTLTPSLFIIDYDKAREVSPTWPGQAIRRRGLVEEQGGSRPLACKCERPHLEGSGV